MITNIGTIFAQSEEGKEVTVRGWIHRHRSSGNMVFAVIRDHTGILQVTVKKDKVSEKDWKSSNDAYVESSLIVRGTVKKDERAPGGLELQATGFELISRGEPFPIAKDLSEEYLMDIRHLWTRSQKISSIMKARHHIVNYLREFFISEEFYEVAPPIITKSGCEGGSTLFEMDYFGEPAYLTQSSQMYAEVFVFSLGKVFVLAPSFRAEKSRTKRHLAEYWHLEPEMAFYDHKMNMELQEQMVRYVVEKMLKEHSELLKTCGRNPLDLEKIKDPFEKIDYKVAVERVNEFGGKMEWGEDFGADEEALLTKDQERPLFVEKFPKAIKSFYMEEDPKNPEVVLANDLLAPQGHGEIIGGSERIWDYDKLLARMNEQNLDLKNYQWYLDLRKYGSIPHSGFGLGIERVVKWMLDLDHIRDTIPFPRTINRCYP
ncbi:asparagine--tRNA ligase [Candidatus Micrarchaeota archaeon]|nr:asparagine--tRNA ligase [Candidatus Micrarchaeota archaeon]MBU1681588.1 asparagine--tRNA ligase [Candidatus Micrarchaeota archaeon]